MRNFNSNFFKSILKFPEKTEINEKLYQEMDEFIKNSQEMEIFWSKEFFLNPKSLRIREMYHVSRIFKCSIIGFKEELKKAGVKKENPKILVKNRDFFENLNDYWNGLVLSIEHRVKKRYISSKEIKKFREFEDSWKHFILIGRKKDIENISPSIVSEVKNNFENATSEF